MALTYEPISTTTLGSASGTITFTSIPSTYTDLRLVFVVPTASAIGNSSIVRFNNNSATNYSQTYLAGNNATAYSGITTNQSSITIGSQIGTSTTLPVMYTLDIFSYAGSTNKTVLITENEDRNASNGGVTLDVGLWRSTSAINQVDIVLNGGATYSIGTTATLYGIKAA